MVVRFNSPPGWPTPPADWTPPPGWQPDPSWPSLPVGWQLFVDDAVPTFAAPTAGYPTADYPTATYPPAVYPPAPIPTSAPAYGPPAGAGYPPGNPVALPIQSQYRPTAQPGPLGKDRSPAAVLGLSIITLGIYYLVWYGMINGEIRRHDPDIKVRPGLAVLALFLPIFNIVSSYSTAARVRQMQLDAGQQQTISPVVALLLYLFLGIGYPLYLASQLREFWHGQRRASR